MQDYVFVVKVCWCERSTITLRVKPWDSKPKVTKENDGRVLNTWLGVTVLIVKKVHISVRLKVCEM